MSELVNKNGRAKQHQHGDNDINDIQNGHVKNQPQRRDSVNISGKILSAMAERFFNG
jgi:hypothetical protein